MSKNAGKKRKLQKLTPMEGVITVSFVLGGRKQVVTHKLSDFEIRHMKRLCEEHGEDAAAQIVWRGALKMGQAVAQNCIAQAGLAYVQQNWKGKETPAAEPPKENVFSAVGLGYAANEQAQEVTVREETLVKEGEESAALIALECPPDPETVDRELASKGEI